MEELVKIIGSSIIFGLIYGGIKTALEMKYPERYGLEPDWYKDNSDESE